jgi:hypothetical protein
MYVATTACEVEQPNKPLRPTISLGRPLRGLARELAA